MSIKAGDQVIAYNNSVEAYLKDSYGNVNTQRKAIVTYGIPLEGDPETRIWNAGDLMGIYTGEAVTFGGVSYLEFTYKATLRTLKSTFFGSKTHLSDIEAIAYVPSSRVVNDPLKALNPESSTAGEKNGGTNDNETDPQDKSLLAGLTGTKSEESNTTTIIVAVSAVLTIGITLLLTLGKKKTKSK